jgi:hypothetical protein
LGLKTERTPKVKYIKKEKQNEKEEKKRVENKNVTFEMTKEGNILIKL